MSDKRADLYKRVDAAGLMALARAMPAGLSHGRVDRPAPRYGGKSYCLDGACFPGAIFVSLLLRRKKPGTRHAADGERREIFPTFYAAA